MTGAGEDACPPVRDDEVAAAARVLAAGGVVAYPTETVYGLGVDATSRAAIERLLEAKGRDAGRGISVLVSDLAMAAPLLAAPPPKAAIALARRYWPGPLTIVLPASASVAAELRGPSGGVGLRCSSDPWAAALLARFGAPLTSTSANRSGDEPARDAAGARAVFRAGVFVLDGGARLGSAVSTVIEFAGGRATVLRAGAIPAEEIASFIQQTE